MKKIISVIKSNLVLTSSVAATALIWIVDHDKGIEVLKNFLSTCKSTIPILILMFALLAFIKVAMGSVAVQKAIEKNTGIRSTLLAYLFGFLVSGPIYPGFSLGKMLMERGIKSHVIIIMLSTWATLKIPMMPFEIKILGAYTTVVRWIITAIVIFLMSMLCEVLINHFDKNKVKKQAEIRELGE